MDLAVNDHLAVVHGKAMAPTQYRFAPYFIAQEILNLAVVAGAPNNSFTLLHIYLIIQIVVMAVAYYLLLVFLMRWFDPSRAVLGLCFFVAVNPLAEYQYYLQPGDCWSLLLFLLGYLAMAADRDWWLFPIILIGVPFRETIGLLIPAWVCLRWGRIGWGTFIVQLIAFSLAFLAPYALIHLAYGSRNGIMSRPGRSGTGTRTCLCTT